MAEEKGGGKVYNVKVNIQKPYEVTLPKNEFSDPSIEKKYIKEAKDKGYDSVIFKEKDPDQYSAGTFYAVFSPDQVKIEKKETI